MIVHKPKLSLDVSSPGAIVVALQAASHDYLDSAEECQADGRDASPWLIASRILEQAAADLEIALEALYS